MIKKKPFHPPQDEMHALEVRQWETASNTRLNCTESAIVVVTTGAKRVAKGKRGMQCSCPLKQEEENKQKRNKHRRNSTRKATNNTNTKTKTRQRERKRKREKQNQKQSKTRAGGAGGPEAEQLHAYTCDGQCNCAHASKSTQDIHRPKNQHYETTRASDTPTFAKSVSLKKYIACMYV